MRSLCFYHLLFGYKQVKQLKLVKKSSSLPHFTSFFITNPYIFVSFPVAKKSIPTTTDTNGKKSYSVGCNTNSDLFPPSQNITLF